MIQDSKNEPKLKGWDVVFLVIFVPLVFAAGYWGLGWWMVWLDEGPLFEHSSSLFYKI
ncbi:unnamed protein product, partial [marine sediment metagenome]